MTDEHVTDRLGAERDGPDGALEGVRDGADVSAKRVQEMDHARLDQVRNDLDDVDAALGRLEEGTYGRCEACGQPIGHERLEVLPAARYCLRHQRVGEAGDAPAAPPGRL
jgi:RNA polymerase-binding transcription factor DksA